MNRRVYTARVYEGKGGNLSARVSRDGDSQYARLDFSTVNHALSISLPREQLMDLREVLTAVLSDWP